MSSMTNADVQLLVAQARAEAENPAFRVTNMFLSPIVKVCSADTTVNTRRTSQCEWTSLAWNWKETYKSDN